ncbi:DNA-3-methyladenine glycosylase [Vittaforma corneae ATCC 50505]|uniref:DNA-3-methyladenine glycosylase II n=1 Tax=Vittaforma corneae (strain ATCC 50505) TaxID=993615 RepID=L2GJY4_VITCO|nr:DNA-3-methyladenine glycosylase [Vittaforma corneae ATCC 50505]ELA40830.1 DNA-3-methyladenine glycosylase [Vittaforma corneae ATCC 50505]
MDSADHKEDTFKTAHRSCVHLAKMLLGKVLCRRVSDRILKGIIVETEAYLGPEDEAAHSFRGRRTPRNEAMYLGMGTCYVYIIYGIHHCFNISSREEGSAVLVRALQPLEGIDMMIKHREAAGMKEHKKNIENISNGPSKLCIAMAITRSEINGENVVTSDKIWLEKGRPVGENEVVATKRIGIKNAGAWEEMHLRFYIENSPFVSCRRSQNKNF